MDKFNRKDQKTVDLSNGEQISYIEAGNSSSPVLILVHGGASSARSWESVIPELQQDFRVIAVDLRGHGLSSRNNPATSIKDYAEDVKLLCDALQLKKISFLGWSLGGGLALLFAAMYPDYVEKIILKNTMGPKGFAQFKVNENFEPTQKRLTTLEEAEKATAFLVTLAESKDLKKIREFWTFTFYDPSSLQGEVLDMFAHCTFTCRAWADDCISVNAFNISDEDNEVAKGTNEISKVKCPVLILHGANDILVPTSASDIMKALGNQAELRVYENTGHNLCLEQKEKFLKDLREFMLA